MLVFKDAGISYLVFIWIVYSLQKSFTYISLFPHYNKPYHFVDSKTEAQINVTHKKRGENIKIQAII